jgi:hypothetical protein
VSDDAPYPRFASRGKACVYLMPWREADLLKIGFSRDPFGRFSALHRRFFDVFDLDRAVLVEVDAVKDARRIERRLIESLADARAMPPLVVRSAAAGDTEWYAGANGPARALLSHLARQEGWPSHVGIRPWLLSHIMQRADLLHDWAGRLVDVLRWAAVNAPGDPDERRLERALRDTLDLFDAAGADLAALVPPHVLEWRAMQR